MSRCFPFPPPGYARKVGIQSADTVNLLKQDKHRDKGRKEKKDIEKREGKERKEKDRSDEKHRGKKEKKDKHREKDRKKEKEKEKEKERQKDHSSSSNDKKLPLSTGVINEEKTPKEKGPPSVLPVVQAGDRSARKEKERDRYGNSTPDRKRPAGQNVEKMVSINNNSLRDIGDDNKYVQELEKRVIDSRTSGTQLAEKFMAVERKKDDDMVQFLARPDADIRPKGKEWNKERRYCEQKVERVNGILKVQNFSGAVQSRVQEVTTPLVQNVEREMEQREKFKGREEEGKWADKWKEKDWEKNGQGKVREEERAREKSEHNSHRGQERLMLSRKNDLLSSPNAKNLQQPVKEPDKTAVAVIKKRKEPEANGFLHANGIRSNKMPKQTLASHAPLENGRMLEPYQTPPVQVSPPWSGPDNNSNNVLRAKKEDKKINGVTETWLTPPISSPVNIQSSTSQANSLPLPAEVPLVRSPHPDSKYLDEILSRIPRMQELPELDDNQGWLFDTDCGDSKKSKRDHMVGNEVHQVWGESLHIESADIYALPYVLPY